jgi:hypothetical protein
LCKQNARKTNQCFLRLEGGFRVEVWLNRCLVKIMGSLFISESKFWFYFFVLVWRFGGCHKAVWGVGPLVLQAKLPFCTHILGISCFH